LSRMQRVQLRTWSHRHPPIGGPLLVTVDAYRFYG